MTTREIRRYGLKVMRRLGMVEWIPGDYDTHNTMARQPKWDEDYKRTGAMFRECGVEVVWWRRNA